jgi:hypothetical protein
MITSRRNKDPKAESKPNEICSRTVHDDNNTPFSASTFEKLTRISTKRHPSCNVRPKFHQWDFVPMHLHSDNTVTAVTFKYQPKSADFHSIITSLTPRLFLFSRLNSFNGVPSCILDLIQNILCDETSALSLLQNKNNSYTPVPKDKLFIIFINNTAKKKHINFLGY